MDEGVDPTKMCRRLVDKVSQSNMLMAVAHPEILVLFESWLEELEDEVVACLSGSEPDVDILVGKTGLSATGAAFILAKLKREGRI